MLTDRPYWPYPRIIAHRGGGLLAPENTLAALRYAANLGLAGQISQLRLVPRGHVHAFYDVILR